MWKTTATIAGKTVEGTWVSRLSRTQNCFLTYGDNGVIPANDAIHGYDPVARQWKITTHYSDGAYSVEVLAVKDMEKGKQLGNGHTSTSSVKRYLTDGTTKTASYTLTLGEYSKDRMEVILSDRREDGQPQPDVRLVMDRQQATVRGTTP